jgi:cytochrome b pre-mRNA-processing protein 3
VCNLHRCQLELAATLRSGGIIKLLLKYHGVLVAPVLAVGIEFGLGPEKIGHLRDSVCNWTRIQEWHFCLMQRIVLRPSRPILTQLHAYSLRQYASAPTPAPTPGPSKPYRREKGPTREPSWLTRKLKQSPTAMGAFLKVFGALGYGSSKQIAARRALALYERLCAGRAEEDSVFWAKGMRAILLPNSPFDRRVFCAPPGTIECHLPPTFQSWFTVTNLHVWILTTRLRALPAPHGRAYIQGLIDHFFLDVEDRIRQVLQPRPRSPENQTSPNTNTTPITTTPSRPASFYEPNSSTLPDATTVKKRGRAPEALVTKQMKIFREQWAGLGLSLDLALAEGSDAMLAGVIWRNFLGARGAQGFALALAPSSPTLAAPEFRRAVNQARMSETERAREERRDDGSGVHDFGPEDRDAYVRFPETMLVLMAYIRSEVARLADISDERIMGSVAALGREADGVDALRFKKISSVKVARGYAQHVARFCVGLRRAGREKSKR